MPKSVLLSHRVENRTKNFQKQESFVFLEQEVLCVVLLIFSVCLPLCHKATPDANLSLLCVQEIESETEYDIFQECVAIT